MDLTLTDDEELVAATARDFLESRSPQTDASAVADDPAGYSAELWKQTAELGWIGLALPERHGGGDGRFLDLCLIVEQFGRFQIPTPLVATSVLCALPIHRFGTEGQKSAWLGPIARGERIMTFARAAPGGGWSPVGSTVTAKSGNGGYILDGTAWFVPWADVAGELLVAAHRDIDEPDELTVFLIETAEEGVEIEALETVGLERRSRVELRSVPVTEANVLGKPGAGRGIVETTTQFGAVATCAEMVGGAERVLEMTVEYAKERRQFDRSIGSFQAIQHHCADMATDVLASRFITYEAAWRLSVGLDAAEEVSMAKGWVSEAYRRVCARGHQVHGAIGFTQEHGLHRYFRHAIASELTFGDGDFHWDRLATQLGLPAEKIRG